MWKEILPGLLFFLSSHCRFLLSLQLCFSCPSDLFSVFLLFLFSQEMMDMLYMHQWGHENPERSEKSLDRQVIGTIGDQVGVGQCPGETVQRCAHRVFSTALLRSVECPFRDSFFFHCFSFLSCFLFLSFSPLLLYLTLSFGFALFACPSPLLIPSLNLFSNVHCLPPFLCSLLPSSSDSPSLVLLAFLIWGMLLFPVSALGTNPVTIFQPDNSAKNISAGSGQTGFIITKPSNPVCGTAAGVFALVEFQVWQTVS